MTDRPLPAAHESAPSRFKRIHVIANPAAGQDRPFLNVMNSAFNDAGMEWELLITKEAGDGTKLAKEAVAAGTDVVAAYGGDGTVMEVANGLIDSHVPLAIFPGGTANVMSVELGIPGDLAQAVALTCGQGGLRPVDMARVNDRLFMLRVTIGFTAEMTKGADQEEKNRLGAVAYWLAGLRALPTAQAARYRLQLDGETVETEGAACIVANSSNLGLPGVFLNPKADVSDGLLDVYVITGVDIGSLLTVAASAIGVTQLAQHWQARDITVTADPEQTVECDGEIIEPTPLRAQIVPQPIRVVVPAPADEA